MIVPHDRLSAEALAGVIEEYVTRDGTELTDAEAKTTAVRALLDRGELVLVYDTEAESCNIVSPEQAAAELESRRRRLECEPECDDGVTYDADREPHE